MKQAFESKNFRPSSLSLIEKVNEVLATYAAQGYTMTLRQVYYQLVAADVIPNKQTAYDNLGALIVDARRAGMIDWRLMEDRTRNIAQINAWETTESFAENFDYWFRQERWKEQSTIIELWVEKEALAGVIQRAANKYFMPWMACRGYMADIEMYDAAQRMLRRYRATKQKTVILHFGDHDPSGIDMTRDNADRLYYFGCGSAVVEVVRVALNMDQVQTHNPPPNPAKQTDCRFKGYADLHGEYSWELDALKPEILAGLVDSHWEELVDKRVWNKAVLYEKAGKEQLKDLSTRWSNIEELIGTQRMFLPGGKTPDSYVEIEDEGEEPSDDDLPLDDAEDEGGEDDE